MTLGRCKLKQRRGRALASGFALRAHKAAGEIVHACRSDAPERREIDITTRLAPTAFDLQPREAAIDRLIDGRRRINWPAVAPHLFIPALTGQIVGLADQRLANAPLFGRALGEDASHRPRLHKLFRECLAVTAGERCRVMLWSHGTSERFARPCAIALYVGPGPTFVLQPVVAYQKVGEVVRQPSLQRPFPRVVWAGE